MKYTKVVLVNKNQYLSKKERAEILHYANTFIWGASVEDDEKTFIMSITHIDGNVYEVRRCFWQFTALGRTLSSPYTALIKLK